MDDDRAKIVRYLEEEFDWLWNRYGACVPIHNGEVLQYTLVGVKMQGEFMSLKDDMDFTPPMSRDYCPRCQAENPAENFICQTCGYVNYGAYDTD